MSETTKHRDGIALNVLEAIGHGAVRVERARRELDQLVSLGDEMAARLRVAANCLDSRRPEKIGGMMDGGLYLLKNGGGEDFSVYEHWEADPSVKNVFRIPERIKELMGRIHEAEKLLCSYEDMLNSSLRSYLRNCVDGAE